MKKINFMVTAFRDGFQSVYGGRVYAKDYMPAVEAAKEAGITHFEAGGGAMFQSPFFYANENAFDNMDLFRKTVGKDVNLQTLARGVNVVGLDSQSSDIIKLHADMFKKHGITTIRNFDALNDVNNLIYSGKCIKEAGLRHEVCVTLMSLAPGWDKEGKVHTPEFYADTLKKIMDAGIEFDSVCFKDASGTATPHTAGKTIALARKLLGDKINITYHTHETAGASIACYLEAIKAGADTVDLSMSPVSGGTCSPDVATMWHALRGTDYTLDIDINKLMKAEEVFKDCMKDYFLPPEATAVDPRIPFAPMPGGALTANTQMMRDAGILDRYEEVFSNMGECVRRGGFGTSVTPVSQFYFQQAFNNTMFGPWKKFAEGYGKMVLGYFGKTPVAPDPEIVKLASEQMGLEPTTKTVLEINDANPKKGRKPAEEKLKAAGLPVTDENVFITAACGDKGITFLKGEAKTSVRKGAASKPADGAAASGPVEVTVDGSKFTVDIQGDKAVVNGKSYSISVGAASAPSSSAPKASGEAKTITAPMPGIILRTVAKNGDSVKDGQTILVMEAMKMEVEVKAQSEGSVTLLVKQGDNVQTGTPIAEVK
ncbi:pyruvate carboxylase subunit B [Parelusimicrobium proximum]|uniref:biotin/lipoyl-containing protein n=1 Tax=Parelusimicrobium proximum TaxID=3228953 RepID=UPI003D17E593